VLSVNTLGIVHGIAAFVPAMLAAGREGHIVNTASIQGLTTATLACPYTASKHAALAISESLRLQLQGTPIGVSVLLPGPVRTNMMARARAHATRAGLALPPPDVASRSVGGQVNYLEPADIAEIVAQGVRDKRFYLFTHPDSRRRVSERYERVLADLAD
jgi:short-subunit dehydrogenase